ncbi:MAG: 50S ribosomal protein L32e [Candidatus Parvarchaeota archaeon]|nr:50S ribosomal protein L32e [Candidatus Jingweiarchaeum tengchongense]MCW1297787.1 50S ribosomal protein L32e [Candidatus Jingweiarchaeum tengchongense]MCW1299797.1 50S ribosomal protein L32e [Candidatus Jingweiarchaeum tengchongense]MCW1304232.1 50S ribosomal protein L32e [Candidatus Jingweiarchaeum tengchongense]MCW1305260.1 50S ribosomal protein L32e [Candidatus Jingweiarchaeum tengchongense]
MKRLLKLRRKIKRKKPIFIRRECHRRKRLKEVWRRPKGLHSKVRKKKSYVSKMPSPSYSSPKEVKFLHPSGLEEIYVANVKDLEKVKDKERQGIRIAAVGKKKKVEIVKEAMARGIKILNLKKPEEFLKKFEAKKNEAGSAKEANK